MRKQLCDALVARAAKSDMVFLTGDLGFMALEPLQMIMGSRFINAGVAEQNMISVAAALAAQDFEVWVYSIAPFVYARPFEQIRNDIAFHNLPVKLIGNGGGYGYGVMGPTHHAIDDYGVLLTLPNMTVYVPVFDEDMDAVISRAGSSGRPSYIRMGRGEPPKGYLVPDYAPWRQLTHGNGPVVIAVPVIDYRLEAAGVQSGPGCEQAVQNLVEAKRWVIDRGGAAMNAESVIPGNAPLGAEVRGGDVASDPDDSAVQHVKVALLRHLWLRGSPSHRDCSRQTIRQRQFERPAETHPAREPTVILDQTDSETFEACFEPRPLTPESKRALNARHRHEALIRVPAKIVDGHRRPVRQRLDAHHVDTNGTVPVNGSQSKSCLVTH